MNNLVKVKKLYIELLQKHNYWGKSKEEMDSLLDGEEPIDADVQYVYTFQTNLLIDTNLIVSPIFLDNTIELPIVELFIDKDNFVVLTTKYIYNCRNAFINKVEYKDILGVDEMSIIDFTRKRSTFKKIEQFVDINLIISDGLKIPIMLEYSISFRPIIYFLTVVNKQKKEF